MFEQLRKMKPADARMIGKAIADDKTVGKATIAAALKGEGKFEFADPMIGCRRFGELP